MKTDAEYLAAARIAYTAEEAQRTEAAITERAAALRIADERAQQHRDLCAEFELPLTATPRQISDAMAKQRNEILGAVASGNPGDFAKLCRQLGLDPASLPGNAYETV
jgi:hypothetical protein